jgi:lysine 2,3-aminomutase
MVLSSLIHPEIRHAALARLCRFARAAPVPKNSEGKQHIGKFDKFAKPSPSDTARLRTLGLVSDMDDATRDAVTRRFPFRVTPAIQNAIVSGIAPIARQFVPDARELTVHPWEDADPIGDDAHSPVKGIVHRYPDRALLKLTASCPVHCRFCFRKEMIGPESANRLTPIELNTALEYINENKAIWEVVVTGGDPLALSPRRLRAVTERLDAIGHVAVIRWHSRVPIVSPETLTDAPVAALTATEKTVYVAVHTNHASEHTDAVEAACRRLRQAGIVLVGQSVLLRGVNASTEALADLMRSCVRLGIKPYYLHLLDRAKGTSHFRVPLSEAVALVTSLRGHVSGLCQPTLMLDLPGGYGKVPLADGGIVARNGNRYTVRDHLGRVHDYVDHV